ncbi:hypothetical protein B0H14DRAFT_2573068 [Mycena olivaceomarginata]|nr:hypothetical protein B0H14DRAFT_2573068 [Mycena olivaceomarginata]
MAFLQLVPNGQMLENEKNSLPPSPSRFRMACALKFFQGTKFNSEEDRDSSSQKSWYLVWDVGLFTSRTAAKAYLDNPSSQALTQHLQHSDTLEKWGLLCGKHHQDEEYGETVPNSEPEQTSTGEHQSPAVSATTKSDIRTHYQGGVASATYQARVVSPPAIMFQLPGGASSAHPKQQQSQRVSSVWSPPQLSQPANVSVEGKQKALDGLSALQSKSSKTATPVKSKRKSSRDDDKEVDKPPRKCQKKSEEGSGNGSTATRLGRTTGMC